MLSLASAFLLIQLVPVHPVLRWSSLLLPPAVSWLFVEWYGARRRFRIRAAVRAHLNRLPDDFMVLHDLVLPAPWGVTRVDQIILSRYGVVVVSDGPPQGWMCERVEAVRTLLFARGLMRASFPIGPLILLPPGAQACSNTGVSVVRVEHLTLEDLAPVRAPVLTHSQIQLIARCLLQAHAA